jgi:hypothetical protein
VTGEVREPGQGPVPGVRVTEPVSGTATFTDDAGRYTLAGLGGARLRFEKNGYEPGELDITPEGTGFMRMQRVVRIMLGETAVVPKLTHMDMVYDVGGERCSPCRRIRILAPAAGRARLELTWEPDPGSVLHLWAGGQHAAGSKLDRLAAVDVVLNAGENVVHVGYYQWDVIFGSSIQFTLATSMTR